MTSRQVNCAGCRGVIMEDSAFMRCAKCKQYLDILCANFNEEVFATMSTEYKKTWICFECRSKIPKLDNSHTPVRQQLSHDTTAIGDCLDVSMHTPDNNITFRNGKGPAKLLMRNDPCPQNLAPLVQDIKQMQDDFESRLTMRICALLNEKFNEFKASVFEKICNLTSKIDKLEEKILTINKNNSAPTQSYEAAVQHPSNVDCGQTKPTVKSGPQQKNKKTSGKPNPSKKVNAPIATLATVSTLVGSAEQKDPEEWIQVRRKSGRASLPVLRGTAAPGVTKLRASERWRYLHLYYVQEGTTVEEVRAHLHSISGNNDCTVEELKPRGRYSSFKLGVPSRIADNIMSPNNWAEYICVKPWRQNFRAKEKSA
ncbi:hypothetical protein ABMA27_006390 [Loxostege sticticalis]|uniref:Uncharacterized protein n=1 Tax=Loxostege sticticalis TaxID=481309 RepID=A0ABR3IJ05_LOXSC